MAISISGKLRTMKQARDQKTVASGRDLTVVKSATVDRELQKLALKFREAPKNSSKFVSEDAFNAGSAVGANLSLNPALKR